MNNFMTIFKKILLFSMLIMSSFSWASEKIDVSKVSAGFDLSYSYRPLGKGLTRQWSVHVSPDGSIQYRGVYQERMPLALVQSCSNRAGLFMHQLEQSEHQQLMELAMAAMAEQKIIKKEEINKENRERSSSSYTLRSEVNDEFTTAMITNDEGTHIQKFLQALSQILERTYQHPRQAIQLASKALGKSWQLTFTSLATKTQTFVLPAKAYEAFYLIDGLGSRHQVQLEYAQKPKKLIHQLKAGEKVTIEILMPHAVSENQRLVFDNMAIRHHGGRDNLHVQLCDRSE